VRKCDYVELESPYLASRFAFREDDVMFRVRLSRFLPIVLLAATGIATSSVGNGGLTVLAQEVFSHPAHTQAGTCEQPGEIVSTLSPVSTTYDVDGVPMVVPGSVGAPDAIEVEFSSTTLPASLSQIVAGQYIVDVKVSADDQANSVACGPIGGLMLGASDLPFGIAPINNSGHYGTGWLHDNGDGTTTLSLTLIYVGSTAAPPAGATIPVSIENFAFSPSTIAARAGDVVVFTNNDTVPHTVTQSTPSGGFRSDPIAPGTTYTLTIDEPGTYEFYCEFHPAMKGTILASE
jgi:plastocyanin